MVDSISNNAGFQQPPASRAFEPGQAPQNPVDPNQRPQQVAQAPQASAPPTASISSGQTEEINSKLALSRDVSRPDPSQVSGSTSSRGTLLDIKI